MVTDSGEIGVDHLALGRRPLPRALEPVTQRRLRDLGGPGSSRHASTLAEPPGHGKFAPPAGLVPRPVPAYGASRDKEDSMADNVIPAWINLGTLVLLAALVADFAWVFTTAINAH